MKIEEFYNDFSENLIGGVTEILKNTNIEQTPMATLFRRNSHFQFFPLFPFRILDVLPSLY